MSSGPSYLVLLTYGYVKIAAKGRKEVKSDDGILNF